MPMSKMPSRQSARKENEGMTIRHAARSLLVATVLSFLFGCATTKPLHTPTGRPEVTVRSASRKEVVDMLTSSMINAGYSVRNITDYTAEYSKRLSDSVGAQVLFGSRYDSVPEARAHFDVLENQQGVRVVGTLRLITNPGSAFERVTDFSRSSKDAQSYQQMLEQIKWTFDSRETGKIGIAMAPDGTIQQVMSGQPAAHAGLQVGDKIVTIDAKPYPQTQIEALQLITGQPGTKVTLTVVRNGAEKEFTIERREPNQ